MKVFLYTIRGGVLFHISNLNLISPLRLMARIVRGKRCVGNHIILCSGLRERGCLFCGGPFYVSCRYTEGIYYSFLVTEKFIS